MIVEGAAQKADIDGRVKHIRNLTEETMSDDDREKLQERLAKLVGGVAVIKVGAAVVSRAAMLRVLRFPMRDWRAEAICRAHVRQELGYRGRITSYVSVKVHLQSPAQDAQSGPSGKRH